MPKIVNNTIWFSESARRALSYAAEEAENRAVSPEHLLLGLLRDPECIAAKTVQGFGVDPQALSATLRSHLVNRDGSHDTKAIVDIAFVEFHLAKSPSLNTGHLLIAIASRYDTTAGLELRNLGQPTSEIRRRVGELQKSEPKADPTFQKIKSILKSFRTR